ncbi:hypothetical protein GA0116948_102185 [Chitinophaga costaii]|uniref:DUF4834 family protein n=1 Tax=Chitinophaga costaii TaxID=1335309 RepID=A0A1C4AL99_9BACT|nr:DUF4834 family protein [Chitinophaga costaii]PUZ26651.1 hypothetical protein DCM91_09605 [Chitinophaga costaii]SCB95360.1 hypothetical protein GA0116948_102185 [Chitinophaga costaii]
MLENALREIFVIFVGYLLYKFVFNFLLPVVRTTRQVRRQMHDMQQHMQEQFRQQQQPQQSMHNNMNQGTSSQPKRPIEGDYIDFEEVK